MMEREGGEVSHVVGRARAATTFAAPTSVASRSRPPNQNTTSVHPPSTRCHARVVLIPRSLVTAIRCRLVLSHGSIRDTSSPFGSDQSSCSLIQHTLSCSTPH